MFPHHSPVLLYSTASFSKRLRCEVCPTGPFRAVPSPHRHLNHRHPARSGSVGSKRGGRGLRRSENWVLTRGVAGWGRACEARYLDLTRRPTTILSTSSPLQCSPLTLTLTHSKLLLGELLPRPTPASNFKAKEGQSGGRPGASRTLWPALATTRARAHWTSEGSGGRAGTAEAPGAEGRSSSGARASLPSRGPELGRRDPRAVPVAVGPAAGGRAAGSPASRLGALPSPPHVLRAGSSALTAATAVVSALFTQTGARGPGTGIPRPSHVS